MLLVLGGSLSGGKGPFATTKRPTVEWETMKMMISFFRRWRTKGNLVEFACRLQLFMKTLTMISVVRQSAQYRRGCGEKTCTHPQLGFDHEPMLSTLTPKSCPSSKEVTRSTDTMLLPATSPGCSTGVRLTLSKHPTTTLLQPYNCPAHGFNKTTPTLPRLLEE